MEPDLLLLDEPMAGMNTEEKHDMGVVMDISDRVVVLDYGRKLADGPPDEVRSNQEVIDAYLGVPHE